MGDFNNWLLAENDSRQSLSSLTGISLFCIEETRYTAVHSNYANQKKFFQL